MLFHWRCFVNDTRFHFNQWTDFLTDVFMIVVKKNSQPKYFLIRASTIYTFIFNLFFYFLLLIHIFPNSAYDFLYYILILKFCFAALYFPVQE